MLKRAGSQQSGSPPYYSEKRRLLKIEPKTVQGILRHAKIQTTLDLFMQENSDETRAAQGDSRGDERDGELKVVGWSFRCHVR